MPLIWRLRPPTNMISEANFSSLQFRSTTDWRRSWEAHNCLLHISMSWDQIRKPDTNNLLISQLLKLYVCVFEGFLMRLLWRLPTFFCLILVGLSPLATLTKLVAKLMLEVRCGSAFFKAKSYKRNNTLIFFAMAFQIRTWTLVLKWWLSSTI